MADTIEKPAPEGDRLAKVIARAGLCSRRDAEKWIADGRISVDGHVVLSPATNVLETQTILVDGEPLAARHGTRLWLYHKPSGLVVTEKDPEGRPTIFEKLEEEGLPRVVTVGRLDINTEGLLLLTNDGGLKRVLELPATGWLRRYRVRAFGSIDQARLDTLKSGMEVEGIQYGPIEAVLERVQGGNVWLIVALREGKNREVKNVLGALGLQVNRLIRISYGPFQLGDLAVGAVSLIKSKVLRDQLGERLARDAGADFDSAFPEEAFQKLGEQPPAPSTKPAKNPRDPNSRLRQPLARTTAKVPVPRPKTGEPRFAKKRAESKTPPPGRFGKGDEPDYKPAVRRVLFDDGRELVEDAPRPRRDARSDESGPRRGSSERPARDGERKSYGDRKSFGDRADRPRTERPGDKPFSKAGPRPEGRSGAKPFARSGNAPYNKDAPRPSSRTSGKPYSKDASRPPSHSGDKPFVRSGDKPYNKDAPRSSSRTSGKPYSKDASRPAARSGDKPFARAGDAPYSKDAARPSSRTSGKPYSRDGERPSGRTGDKPYARSGDKPYGRSGDKPFNREGGKPQSGARPARSFGAGKPGPGGAGKPRGPARPGGSGKPSGSRSGGSSRPSGPRGSKPRS